MALILNSAKITQADFADRNREERLWIYCLLDSCIMYEIHERTEPQLTPISRKTYYFDMAMRGPAMSMTLRGMRVDRDELTTYVWERQQILKRVEGFLHRIVMEVWKKGINPNSPPQIKDLLYNVMKLPMQYKSDKGEKKETTDRSALEKLKLYYWATPIVNCILKIRDLNKQIQELKSGIDPDGRMRFGFSPCVTETGRWSSSKNSKGRGTNGQNVNDALRRVYISDEGMKLAYVDLEQAESRCVAYESEDLAYIAAVESGDLHTTVARLVWPELSWTGDPTTDRAIADQPFYRHFSYRDMSKRGGHLTNYMGKPWTMSRALQLAQKVCEEFQDRYFSQFPLIKRWHQTVQENLQANGYSITPYFERRRRYHGRLRDDATLREAIANDPQSTIADIVSYGLLKAWKKYDLGSGRVHFFSNQHDGLVYGYWEGDEEVCYLIEEELSIPIPIKGRTMLIPAETKVGYCWNSDSLARLGSEKAAAQTRPNSADPLDLIAG